MKNINIESYKILFLFILTFSAANIGFAATASKQHVITSKKSKQIQHKQKHKKVVKRHISEIVTLEPEDQELLFNKTEIKAPTNSLSATNNSFEQQVVDFVRKMVANQQFSSYKFGGTRFDASHGIYILDCSSYVDKILQTVYPNAYSSLVHSTGSEKPTSLNFYNFFSRLTNNSKLYWNKVEDIEDLQAGDILVFRDKFSSRAAAKGHVMVVMNKIMRDMNTAFVQVADSAPSGHSQDTRLPHVSGIGIGTLLLKANPETGQPFAYAWKIGSSWKKNVRIAMARPIEYS